MTRDKNNPRSGGTRRDALCGMAAAVCSGLATLALPRSLCARETPTPAATPAPAPRRPNVVFILSDDHRWDHLGCTGHSFVKTPHLDRLATQGALFANAFVTTSLCSPSRASFLTGQYAHGHGVTGNLTPWNNDNVTFLELFKNAGYATAFVGKWHMPGRLPALRGVDHFLTFTIQAGQGRYFDCPLIVDGKPEPSRKSYITEELTDRALAWIEEQGDQPFCLFLAHKAAHHLFLPPPDLAGMYDEVELDLPPEADPWITGVDGAAYFGTLGPLSMHYRNYCETITALDREIGRFVDRLDALGIGQDTVIVYAGDNGYFWGEHRLLDKRWPYEESIRIPWIVRGPSGLVHPGRREQMVINTDLAPTLLDLADISVPTQMEGASFRAALRRPDAPGRSAWLYEYFRDYPYRVPYHRAVRTRTHKYIHYEGRRQPELYDLMADPREQQNLFGRPAQDAVVADLKATLDALIADPLSTVPRG